MTGRLGSVLLLAMSSLCSNCSSDGPEDEAAGCKPLNIVGTPFASNGSATLIGTGTLPDGIPDGLDLQLLLGSEGFAVGVLADNLFAPSNTCGRSVTYTIGKISAGTYRLQFEILDPERDDFVALHEGRSSEAFTIQDAQTLTFDATFVR